jgi:ubiquinone/menaquinone biosynthesis C-methylase UbiE
MIFMNYGWADLDPDAEPLALLPEDESNRYSIQLYHRVASAIDLQGLDVLEVGCGRGGGASYVMRYLKPRSMTGLDLTSESIAFCQRHYTTPGLNFVQGDAEALDLTTRADSEPFDAVVNVESSHCYGAMDKFLAGAYRILKPGGHFLFADFRDADEIDGLRRTFTDAGFRILEEEDIGANVVHALEVDNDRKQALIQKKVPKFMRHFFSEFAGMKGTKSSYSTFRSGEKTYLRLVAQK